MAGPTGVVIGRDAELARLTAVLREALSGTGAAVLVEGEPGIGKSTLISAALDSAVRGLGTMPEVLWIESSALAGRVPRALADWAAQPAAATRLVRRSKAIEVVSDLSEASPGTADAVESDLLRMAQRLLAYDPAAVIFKNLQDADDTAVALWRRLVTTTRHVPLALIGTRWPVPTFPELDRRRAELALDGVLTLGLAPLAEQEVTDLVRALLGTRPGARFSEALAAAAGNPRYVGEIVRAVVRSGALEIGVSHVDLDPEAAAVPTDWVEAALDFLKPQTLEVLRRAATLEPEFSASDLVLLSTDSPMELIPAIDEASSAGLIESAGPTSRFRHPVIRAGLRGTMSPEDRIALHRRAALTLVAARANTRSIVRRLHSTLGAEFEPWVVDWLADNIRPLIRQTPEDAADLFAAALSDLETDDPRRTTLEDALATVDIRLARLDDGIRLAREVVEHCSEPERVARTSFLLGQGLQLRLDAPDEMLRVLERVATDPEAPELWRVRCTALRAYGFALHGRYAEAREDAERALTDGRRLDDAMAIGHALHAESVVAMVPDHDARTGAALLEQALAATRIDPSLTDLQTSLWGRHLIAGFEIGTPAHELLDSGRRGLAFAATAGSPFRAEFRMDFAETAYELGMWDEASAVLAAEDESPAASTGLAIAAHIAARRGQWTHVASGRAALRGLHLEPSSLPRLVAHRHVLAVNALECERNGSAEQAAAVLAEILEPEAEDRHPQRHRLLPALTRYALAAGDGQTADAAARVAASNSSVEPLTGKLAADRWCRGLVTGNVVDVATATELLRGAGARASLGNALEDAAVLHAQTGEIEAARETLAEALEVYASLDAAWDTRRAVSRLHAHGIRLTARQRRRLQGGASHPLTAAELRVGELVAEGYSNPEIAARLNLSSRTVRSHVSRVLAKLGVSSRYEVRAHLPPKRTDAPAPGGATRSGA
jgi:DNA-binding CsgD family transcriptional regulator